MAKTLDRTGKLTDKQALFVREYLVDLNATQAACRAGYSPETAHVIGTENLAKPYIVEAIARLRAERVKKLDITAERVLQGLAEIAFSNMMDFMHVASDGSARIDLSSVDRTHAGGIAQITTEAVKGGGRDGVRTKLKLANRLAALTTLAKYLKLVGRGEERDLPPVTLIINNAPARDAGVYD